MEGGVQLSEPESATAPLSPDCACDETSARSLVLTPRRLRRMNHSALSEGAGATRRVVVLPFADRPERAYVRNSVRSLLRTYARPRDQIVTEMSSWPSVVTTSTELT